MMKSLRNSRIGKAWRTMRTRQPTYAPTVPGKIRFCDDLGPDGFSWIVGESMTRTSHALASGGKVWLIDPVDWPDAIDRARSLGEPAAVVQLLDRHNRDCAAVAD